MICFLGRRGSPLGTWVCWVLAEGGWGTRHIRLPYAVGRQAGMGAVSHPFWAPTGLARMGWR